MHGSSIWFINAGLDRNSTMILMIIYRYIIKSLQLNRYTVANLFSYHANINILPNIITNSFGHNDITLKTYVHPETICIFDFNSNSVVFYSMQVEFVSM